MEQAVRPAIAGNAMVDMRQCQFNELLNSSCLQPGFPAGKPHAGVFAIRFAGGPEAVHYRFSLRRRAIGVFDWPVVPEHVLDGAEKFQHFGRDGVSVDAVICQDGRQQPDIPAQVAQRYHRKPVAHQRVVCVIPFGALGIHPDAAPGHEIPDLDQGWQQQLLQEVDPADRPVRQYRELAVAAHRLHPAGDGIFLFVVIGDGIPGILQKF